MLGGVISITELKANTTYVYLCLCTAIYVYERIYGRILQQYLYLYFGIVCIYFYWFFLFLNIS